MLLAALITREANGNTIVDTHPDIRNIDTSCSALRMPDGGGACGPDDYCCEECTSNCGNCDCPEERRRFRAAGGVQDGAQTGVAAHGHADAKAMRRKRPSKRKIKGV